MFGITRYRSLSIRRPKVEKPGRPPGTDILAKVYRFVKFTIGRCLGLAIVDKMWRSYVPRQQLCFRISVEHSLEHGSERSSAHAARMGAIHLDDTQAKGMHGGAAAGVSRTTPPYLAAGSAPVEAEPMRAHFDGRFASLAQAVAKLTRKAGEWKRQTQCRSRLSLRRGRCRRCSCN